eukprot:scaffold9726_cov119-Isochrysis_galbana.AAC.36
MVRPSCSDALGDDSSLKVVMLSSIGHAAPSSGSRMRRSIALTRASKASESSGSSGSRSSRALGGASSAVKSAATRTSVVHAAVSRAVMSRPFKCSTPTSEGVGHSESRKLHLSVEHSIRAFHASCGSGR